MKRVFWVILILGLSLPLKSQKNSDFGIFSGVSSYIGDINPGKLFYSPLPAGGFFFRYNLHPRQSLRTSIFVGVIKASDSDFNNDFQLARGKSFSGIVGEWALQFEFNFLPYSTQGKAWEYTPYIAAGAGIAFINTEVFTYVPVLPFSVGFKANIYKNIGMEAEYGFRKTFYDNFDGLYDLVDPKDYSRIHNNDWYTFAGICFTWKLNSRLAGCPAYNDMDSKRKR
jgi:hypothetical protein